MKTRVQNNGTELKVRMGKAVAFGKAKHKKIMLYAQVLLSLMPLACQSQTGKLASFTYGEEQKPIADVPITSKGTNSNGIMANKDTLKGVPRKSQGISKAKRKSNSLTAPKSNKHSNRKTKDSHLYHSGRDCPYRPRRNCPYYPHGDYHYRSHRNYHYHSHRNSYYHRSHSHGYSTRSRKR